MKKIERVDEFIPFATSLVANEFYDANPDIEGEREVAVVWFCKTLQNMKALLCVPSVRDGKYYEVTYNGDENEVYFDIYKKQLNLKFESDDIEYFFSEAVEEYTPYTRELVE